MEPKGEVSGHGRLSGHSEHRGHREQRGHGEQQSICAMAADELAGAAATLLNEKCFNRWSCYYEHHAASHHRTDARQGGVR